VSADDDVQRRVALRDYARAAYDQQHRRYEWLEQKAHRYLSVLTFIIASASLVLVPAAGVAFREPAHSWPSLGFVSLSFGVFGSSVVSLAAALWSMRPLKIPASECDPDLVIPVFLEQTVGNVAHGEAEQVLGAAFRLRDINENRGGALSHSYRWLWVAGGLYILTLITWFFRRP